ncbi:hypothetical protein E6H29_09820 [Candidatus Bathyarchaeota archaeon]|nr:MAG: hypothetical protein E6H29_09820 [Candidatus Bathyarchaeota archaeon]
MGQQVNFYMTHDDEKEFLNYVKGTGNVEVLPHQSTMSSFVPVVEMPEADQEESNRIFWLFNRSVSSNLVVDYDDDHGVYVIDGLRSSAVEFARCFTRDNRMNAGRIWVEFTTIDNDTMDLGQKEREFKRWYESIANWIRKKYYLTGWLVYAGRGACKFQDEGGILP